MNSIFGYSCECNLCGDTVDASQIQVTVDYGDFYNAETDTLEHIMGLYVECEACIEG